MAESANFSDLIGEHIFKVDINRSSEDEIIFYTLSGKRFRMHYEHDCYAHCSIEDIVGDVEDMEGYVVDAREESNSDNPKSDPDESFTWTFYILQTVKGCVTIRWYGSSNGYYSERASFQRLTRDDYHAEEATNG